MSSRQVRASPATRVVLKMKPTPGVMLGAAGLATQCRERASQEEQHPGDVWFSIRKLHQEPHKTVVSKAMVVSLGGTKTG